MRYDKIDYGLTVLIKILLHFLDVGVMTRLD